MTKLSYTYSAYTNMIFFSSFFRIKIIFPRDPNIIKGAKLSDICLIITIGTRIDEGKSPRFFNTQNPEAIRVSLLC
jgi:hypothetical protein